jgi:putative membrane protein
MHASITIPLLVTGVVYGAGARALRRRSHSAPTLRAVSLFAAGWLTLAVALLGPLHEASEQIFTAHMIQHELLMAVAAPLLVLSRPGPVMLFAFDSRARLGVAGFIRRRGVRRTWASLTRPLHAWLFHGIVIWVWHLPSLFQMTLHSDVAHAAQHASFLGSALIFWWSIVHGPQRTRGTSVISLFTTTVHTGVLGALMAFSRQPWYPDYAASAAAWGLTPMSDQQLAGLVMWVPASLAYLVAALATMRRWLAESEHAVAAAERLTSLA